MSRQNIAEKVMDLQPHSKTSEYREHSQKSQNSEKTATGETSAEVVPRTLDGGPHLGHRENREPSQNSWIQQAKLNTEKVNMSNGFYVGQCSTTLSEFRELSSNSWLESD